MRSLRQYFATLSLAVAIGWIVPTVPAMGQCVLTLKGSVTDVDTKQPLEGASILIVETGQLALSDAKGAFVLNGMCPGAYTIKITHMQCAPLITHRHFQQDIELNVDLPHAVNELEEVTVVGSQSKKSTSISSEVKGKDLDMTRGQSLAEALQRLTGVTMLQTGANISKPVIHGLHSNRVLILNNGIRQEGQQWGSEHAPEIDPFIATRLTVIKGASALRYGADAIGGVVLVEPRLLPTQPGVFGELNTGFFSNNLMGFVSGMVEGSSAKIKGFGWRAQGTYKRGGNSRTPNYWLDNSGLEELNFSTTAGIRTNRKGIELFYSQFNTKLAIFSGSHIGNVTDLMEIINSGQPPSYIIDQPFSYVIDRPFQQIQHHLAKAKAFLNTGEKSRLNLLLSYQYNWRREYDIKRFSNSTNRPQLDLSLSTLGGDLVWDHFGGKRLKGTMGFTGSYQLNSYSERFFVPNYEALNGGVFAIEKYSTGKWVFEAGVRYDVRNIFNITRNNGSAFSDKNFSNVSGNLGVQYKVNDWLSANANVSTAWRAPQVNELFSDGLHHGSARIEKGNPDLLAERANSYMASVNAVRSQWQFEIVAYHKDIDNFIYLKPTYPPQLTIRGAFPSFQYEQTDARLNGLDFNASVAITHHWQWQGKVSIVRAFDKIADDWIIQMPADRFENSIQYQFVNGKKITDPFIKISWLSVLEQTRVPASGEIVITKPDGSKEMASDYAPPPPTYNLFGVEAGFSWMMHNRPVRWQFGVANIFNTVYRDYMNAFRYYADETGINASVKVIVPFGPR
jgi:iron complex outermembrane recepter protein